MTLVSRLAATAVATGAVLLAPWAMGAAPHKSTHAAMPHDAVKHGQYLATVMGCGDCHTPGTLYGSPDHDRALSGSELGWQGPWGVTYARNLTSDKETGIGSWTAEQITQALRSGQRPDGTQLRPPMPWPDFSQLNDADMKDLVAYLQSLPPVHHKVPDALPPGQTAPAGSSALVMPPPPAWDVQHMQGGK